MSSVVKLVGSIPRSPSEWLFEGLARPPTVVWVPAAIVAALLLTAPVYLALRTLGAGPDAVDLIFRAHPLGGCPYRGSYGCRHGGLYRHSHPAGLAHRAYRPSWSGFLARRRHAAPGATPSYIVGFTIAVGLGPRGILQGWLELGFGVDRIPSIYGFPGAAFTLIIISFPYVLLPVRAALWNLDVSLEESARALGRDRRQTFRSVTLPMLRPAILAGGLLTALYALSDFGAVAIMRYETFTWSIFIQFGAALNRNLAAAWSLALIALALAVVWGENAARNAGGGRYYRSGGGATRLPEPVPLGRWRWPALVYCGTVVLLSLGLPLAVLVYWTVRGVAAGEPLELLWRSAANSVSVSALAAVLTVLCAAPIAVLAVRYPGLFSRWLEAAGLRGIRSPRHCHRPGSGLLRRQLRAVALPVPGDAGRGVCDAVPAGGRGVPPSIVGAGETRVRGRRPQPGQAPLTVLLTVTLPLVRPGILTGAALVFLLTMKELPATLILSPIGFTTLASSIWAAAEEAFFPRAAAPALLLVAVSSIPLTIITAREERRQG